MRGYFPLKITDGGRKVVYEPDGGGGCPALGIGDPDHVSRIAGRLSRHEVGPLATLILRGQPVATIDLSKHGSIAQAMTEPSH